MKILLDWSISLTWLKLKESCRSCRSCFLYYLCVKIFKNFGIIPSPPEMIGSSSSWGRLMLKLLKSAINISMESITILAPLDFIKAHHWCSFLLLVPGFPEPDASHCSESLASCNMKGGGMKVWMSHESSGWESVWKVPFTKGGFIKGGRSQVSADDTRLSGTYMWMHMELLWCMMYVLHS